MASITTRTTTLAGLTLAATLGFVAAGVTVSAMTRVLRGGDVLLRVLLFPLVIPLFWAVVSATRGILRDREFTSLELTIVASFAVAYLAVGQLCFEAIVSDYDG